MADLTFFTNPQSRGAIARWMLEETGIAYDTKVLDYGTTMKAPDYLAINPMGKVPAIRHGETVVTETAAICCYLAETFPDAGLAPEPQERGAFYRWMFFAAGPLEAAVTNRALGFSVKPDQKRMAGYGEYDDARNALIGILKEANDRNGYLAGDRFTAVDVYLGSHVGWGMQFGSIEADPAMEAYFARISDRDAYRRAQEKDAALIPQDQG